MKRLTSLALILALIITTTPIPTFAQDEPREESVSSTGTEMEIQATVEADVSNQESSVENEEEALPEPEMDQVDEKTSGENGEDKEETPRQDENLPLTTPGSSLGIEPPILDPPVYEPPKLSTDPKSFLSSFQGKADVSLFTGDLGYSFPLFVPKGRGMMTPNLSLNYSSNDSRFAGMVGYGWSLPQNAIYRVAREGYDRIYENDDYFGIDLFGSSQSLMVVNKEKGQYRAKDGGDGIKYEFDKEANQWLVQDTQGTTYTFGTSEENRQTDPSDKTKVFKWMLERVEDVNGNSMSYTYTKDQNAVYPESIRYTGFGKELGIFEVKFVLEDRSAAYTDYKTAFKVGYGKQIKSIQLWSYESGEPELRMTYELGYKPINAAVTLLTSIQVKAGEKDLPATSFDYFDGTEAEEFKKLYALKTLHLPYGGENSFTYQAATAYREPDQTSSNWLPFVTHTLKTKTEKAGVNEPAYTTHYDYRRGHYYFDDLDAYKREYAGFGKVTVTDPVNNKQVLYFHQSEFDPNNEADMELGEFEDHISKKGRTYRQESYDAEGNLMQEVITKWDKKEFPQADSPEPRFQVLQAQTVGIDHGEKEGEKKTKASSATFDDYGNPLEEIDYGEVELSNNKGEFTDIGQDKIRTKYAYAHNLAENLLSFPQTVERFDQGDQKIGEMKVYYDELALGKIEKGNWTKQERLIDTQNNYAVFAQTYTPEGLPKTFTNPRNYTTQITYEPKALYPQIVSNAKGHKTSYVYDLFFGVPTQMTDPNGHDSKNILDAFGRMESTWMEDASNQMKLAQEYTYDLKATPVTITKTDHLQFNDNKNKLIALTEKTFFDGFSRPIQVKQEAEGGQFVVTSQVYDERGQLKENYLPKFTGGADFELLNPNDPKSVLTYDGLGRPKTETNSLGTTSTSYGAWSQIVTDANGHKKEFLADSRGNLMKVKEHNGDQVYSTKYEYDANNNLRKITDAEGNISDFTYDLLGRRLTQTLLHKPNDNAPATFVFTYDKNGNLLTRKDAKSQLTTYTYDELDRPLTDKTATSTITYTYDEAKGAFPIGRLTSVKGSTMAKNFKYDVMGRMTEELKLLSMGGSYVTKFAYAGISQNLSKIAYPGGVNVGYQYNNAGQMEVVPSYVKNLDYSPIGSITVLEYQNGAKTVSTYDPQKLWRMDSRVTTASNVKVQNIAYTYDPIGNITTITDTSASNASKKAVYTYDDLDRLKTATITKTGNNQNYTQTFDYSPTGNILNKLDVGVYAYNDKHPQAVTQAGPGTYTYDPNGSVLTSGGFTHTYNDRGYLSLSKSKTSHVKYNYDEAGERTNKILSDTEGTAYVNQYFEEDILGNVKEKRSYVYAGPLKIATINPDSSIAFHHEDHLSGANVTTNAQGKVIELMDYYPYGEVRLEEKKEGYENDYLFTGQERDEETNLYYYGARYYDSKIGRFTSIDSWSGNLLLPQSLNKYSYTLNNPLKYTDPTGNVPDPSDAATLAAGPFAPFFFIAKEVLETAILAAVLSAGSEVIPDTYTTPPSPQENPITADVVPQTAPPEPYTTPVAPPLPTNVIVDVQPSPEIPQTYTTPTYTPEQILNDGCGVNMSCMSDYGSTPEGRPFTKHYGEETGPIRNIPGSVVDNVVNNYPAIQAEDGKATHYDKENDVTVVTGDGGSIVSARKGPPRKSQLKG